jgi:prepilin-type N-terminal cleavage/methylation domain-containing protein
MTYHPTARHPAARRRGFTLIELILVIALLGVLAGLATPRVLEVRRSTVGQVEVREWGDAVRSASLAALDGGRPITLSDLVTVMSDGIGAQRYVAQYRAGDPTPDGLAPGEFLAVYPSYSGVMSGELWVFARGWRTSDLIVVRVETPSKFTATVVQVDVTSGRTPMTAGGGIQVANSPTFATLCAGSVSAYSFAVPGASPAAAGDPNPVQILWDATNGVRPEPAITCSKRTSSYTPLPADRHNGSDIGQRPNYPSGA